jgi:hypothetical protein
MLETLQTAFSTARAVRPTSIFCGCCPCAQTAANAEEDAARRLKEIAAMHTEEEWDEILYREARSEP